MRPATGWLASSTMYRSGTIRAHPPDMKTSTSHKWRIKVSFISPRTVTLYCTGKFAGWESIPLIVITTGCRPAGACDGTVTLIWYKPTLEGDRPLKATGAFTPPIVTVGVTVVVASCCDGVGSPLAG